MLKSKYGLDAIMSLHQQLRAIDRATPQARALAEIANATLELRHAQKLAEQVTGGPAMEAYKSAQRMAEQVAGGPAMEAYKSAQRMAEQVTGGPAMEAYKSAQRMAEQVAGGPATEAFKSAQRMAGSTAALRAATVYSEVFWDLKPTEMGPEQRLIRSVLGATRRVALTSLATSDGGRVADLVGSAGFLQKQVAILRELADRVAQSDELQDVAGPLIDIASAAQSLPGENRAREDLAQSLRDLEATLSALKNAVDRPNRQDAVAIVALFVAFFSLFIAFEAPTWSDDIAARQVRQLQDHEQVMAGLRRSAMEQQQIQEQIADLADRVVVCPLKTNARLHARRTGASQVLRTLKSGEFVSVLRVGGRWALVEVETDETVGWLPTKALRLP